LPVFWHFYVFALGRLIPAAEQDDDFLSGILTIYDCFEINPTAGAVINTHFGDTFSYDEKGGAYPDFYGGIAVNSAGNRNPNVAAAAKNQLCAICPKIGWKILTKLI
jgi:acetylornithine/succinyldiaminopimelate/putrescine aminotransferase